MAQTWSASNSWSKGRVTHVSGVCGSFQNKRILGSQNSMYLQLLVCYLKSSIWFLLIWLKGNLRHNSFIIVRKMVYFLQITKGKSKMLNSNSSHINSVNYFDKLCRGIQRNWFNRKTPENHRKCPILYPFSFSIYQLLRRRKFD